MSKRIASRAATWPTTQNPNEWDYSAFDLIDGKHPWQTSVPEGCVLYPVRKLSRGQVLWFNYDLAKEMGLIANDHPNKLTVELDRKIIETFSLQIVNEWDQANGPAIPPNLLKTNRYMATRYLQLQHSDKRGRTSGDGRGIWNGTIRHRGQTWDVSSRGTGVTSLSPGAVEAQRPLKTGTEEFGYGCGLADTTELMGSAIFSEIFHRQGLTTERVLAVIDLGRGVGIGVRASQNLLRPAHLFLWLKQGERDILKRGFDHLIRRQIENDAWSFSARSPDRYRLALREIAMNFARFAALLERRYIFAWLDWDGDNVLASAGIIDYGSIRQFGMRHDQYRYDDVTRYSTNLNEQRGKARFTVQVFAQAVDFIETGRKRSLEAFESCEACRVFDREFDLQLRVEFLCQVGFSRQDAEAFLGDRSKKQIVETLYSRFLALETVKSKSGVKKLADGINRPAVFNMRRVLRELPDLVWVEDDSFNSNSANGTRKRPSAESVLELMKSSFAKRADLRLRGTLKDKVEKFIDCYMEATQKLMGSKPSKSQIKSFKMRSRTLNREGRITGNGSEYIVDEIVKARRRGLPLEDLRQAIDLYIANQASSLHTKTQPQSVSKNAGQLLSTLVNLSMEHEEDI